MQCVKHGIQSVPAVSPEPSGEHRDSVWGWYFGKFSASPLSQSKAEGALADFDFQSILTPKELFKAPKDRFEHKDR